MPTYRKAKPFDIVDTIFQHGKAIKSLQVQNSAQVRKQLNQIVGSLNNNAYFWGLDPTGWAAVNGTFTTVSDPPAGARFPYAAKYVNNGVGIGNLIQSSGYFGSQAFQQYNVSAWVNSSGSSVQIGLSWLNGFLGTVTGPTNPTFAVTPGNWTFLQATLIAPATSVVAAPFIGPPTADGSTIYAQAITAVAVAQPGGWNDLRPLSNSFVGTVAGQYPPQYRLNSDGTVDIAGYVQTPSGATSNYNTLTFATLPAGFRPGSNAGHKWPITDATNFTLVGIPSVQVDTGGNLQFHNLPTTGFGSHLLGIYGRFPLDSSGLILS
jgi:hypothetical protein